MVITKTKKKKKKPMRTEVRLPEPNGSAAPLSETAKVRYSSLMMNERTMKKTISNLYSGEVVNAGYKRGGLDANRFVGFKVGDNVFSNLKLLKQAFGVSNLKDLESEVDRLEQGSITAEFYATEEQYFWGSYLWNGAFRVGTSADRLALAAN